MRKQHFRDKKYLYRIRLFRKHSLMHHCNLLSLTHYRPFLVTLTPSCSLRRSPAHRTVDAWPQFILACLCSIQHFLLNWHWIDKIDVFNIKRKLCSEAKILLMCFAWGKASKRLFFRTNFLIRETETGSIHAFVNFKQQCFCTKNIQNAMKYIIYHLLMLRFQKTRWIRSVLGLFRVVQNPKSKCDKKVQIVPRGEGGGRRFST